MERGLYGLQVESQNSSVLLFARRLFQLASQLAASSVLQSVFIPHTRRRLGVQRR